MIRTRWHLGIMLAQQDPFLSPILLHFRLRVVSATWRVTVSEKQCQSQPDFLSLG